MVRDGASSTSTRRTSPKITPTPASFNTNDNKRAESVSKGAIVAANSLKKAAGTVPKKAAGSVPAKEAGGSVSKAPLALSNNDFAGLENMRGEKATEDPGGKSAKFYKPPDIDPATKAGGPAARKAGGPAPLRGAAPAPAPAPIQAEELKEGKGKLLGLGLFLLLAAVVTVIVVLVTKPWENDPAPAPPPTRELEPPVAEPAPLTPFPPPLNTAPQPFPPPLNTAPLAPLIPSASPTSEPTWRPTEEMLTYDPTTEPTADPSSTPTATPTERPTAIPTRDPTAQPTANPSAQPTASPTGDPTARPTADPTAGPTTRPSRAPSAGPTPLPSSDPSPVPTSDPTAAPTRGVKTIPLSKPKNIATVRGGIGFGGVGPSEFGSIEKEATCGALLSVIPDSKATCEITGVDPARRRLRGRRRGPEDLLLLLFLDRPERRRQEESVKVWFKLEQETTADPEEAMRLAEEMAATIQEAAQSGKLQEAHNQLMVKLYLCDKDPDAECKSFKMLPDVELKPSVQVASERPIAVVAPTPEPTTTPTDPPPPPQTRSPPPPPPPEEKESGGFSWFWMVVLPLVILLVLAVIIASCCCARKCCGGGELRNSANIGEGADESEGGLPPGPEGWAHSFETGGQLPPCPDDDCEVLLPGRDFHVPAIPPCDAISPTEFYSPFR